MSRTERNIRLLVAYDGTDFSGWQRQDSAKGRTVQGVLEAALARLHKRPVNLSAAGRTDAGVHAAGQVANFYTDIKNMAAERFVPALNSLLPQDLRVLAAQETSSEFHARFAAQSRTYRYYIIGERHALPHELRYALQLWRRPRVECLNSYARCLRGELDCSVFALSKDPSHSRNRYFFGALFFVERDTLVFEITANAFLWKMVRSIVGTLLYCEEHDVSPDAFRALLASGERKQAGPTVPPHGLFLWNVAY
ncbi:MAG: tRNA pseudouridine(38-40) synthase TruA [Treponema sp.]|nr:tRNA pseudouridine(38-40) synthase TruA [Treponema sp.]